MFILFIVIIPNQLYQTPPL